jgi:HK97 family phage major capsid protein
MTMKRHPFLFALVAVVAALCAVFLQSLEAGGVILALTVAGVPEELAAAAAAELQKKVGEIGEGIRKNLREQITDLEPRIKKGEAAGEGVAELKEKHAKLSEETAKSVDEIKALVKQYADETNAKLEKARGPRVVLPGTPAFIEGFQKALQAEKFNSRTRGRASYDFDGWPLGQRGAMKAVTVANADVYPPQYVPGLIGPAQRRLTVRDLLPVNRTTANTIYFVKETSVTDNAAPQSALGATKGESSFVFTPDSEAVQTIAHFVVVPTQLLDDITGLEDYINSRMLFLLEREEEDQLLYGSGSGVNLNGLMTQAVALDATLDNELGVEAFQDIDRIRLAIAQVEVAEYPATGIVLHPYNWAGIELLKDAEERYIFAQPQAMSGPRMWGLPVVSTSAMNSGDFLVGAFQLGAAIWDRQQASIQISTEDNDNFRKNLATIRAEERIALTVYRPEAFVQGDFAGVVT